MRVVDSFLLIDGHTPGLEHHRARFARSVAELLGTTVPSWVYDELPDRGRYFPRISATAEGFEVDLRPAPPLRTDTRLWVPPTPDPRRHPTHKGPDLKELAALRAQAQQRGFDDAVLWRDGHLLEAANAAIYFDLGDHILVPEGPRLFSTSLAVLAQGRRVERRRVSIDEALEMPGWCTSALHGPTPIVAWELCG